MNRIGKIAILIFLCLWEGFLAWDYFAHDPLNPFTWARGNTLFVMPALPFIIGLPIAFVIWVLRRVTR